MIIELVVLVVVLIMDLVLWTYSTLSIS